MATVDPVADSVLDQLDWKSRKMLRAIYNNGGQATTSEIKQRTGIDNNDHITHRYRRASIALEPLGLITVSEPELEANGRPRPLEVTLTEQGEVLAQRLTKNGSTPNGLDERLDQLEATVESLEARVTDQCGETETSKTPAGDDLDAQLAMIKGRLTHLEETLDSEYGGWSADKQHEHEVFADGSRAVRDFLLEEHGERFEQYVTEYLDDDE